MTEEDTLTVRALHSLRREVHGLHERVDQTNTRLEQTNDRLERHIEETRRGFASLETRLASELVAVGKTLGEVRDLLRDRLDQRDRLDDHEQRIYALERRIGE
jgi:phage shock protein A